MTSVRPPARGMQATRDECLTAVRARCRAGRVLFSAHASTFAFVRNPYMSTACFGEIEIAIGLTVQDQEIAARDRLVEHNEVRIGGGTNGSVRRHRAGEAQPCARA